MIEKEIKQLKDKIMHCQVENERLELDVECKTKEIEQIKEISVTTKAKEVDNKKIDINKERMRR